MKYLFLLLVLTLGCAANNGHSIVSLDAYLQSAQQDLSAGDSQAAQRELTAAQQAAKQVQTDLKSANQQKKTAQDNLSKLQAKWYVETGQLIDRFLITGLIVTAVGIAGWIAFSIWSGGGLPLILKPISLLIGLFRVPKNDTTATAN